MPQFVTCLNCMDSRVQLPIIDWLKKNYSAEHIDMITEAGMNGFLANTDEWPLDLRREINISLKIHGSKQIFIVGHHDCGEHPVDEITHRKHTLIAVEKLKTLYPDCKVYGLWLCGNLEIEKIVEK